MPRVPVSQFSVKPQGLGAPRLDTPTPRTVANSAEFFGGVEAKQDAEFGQALTRTGANVGVIVAQVQQRENEDAVNRALTPFKEDMLKFELESRKTRQGRYAENLTDEAAKSFDDIAKSHRDTLKNPVQQRLFDERQRGTRESALRSLSQFQAVQLEKSADESSAAFKGASVNAAIQTMAPEVIGTARDEIIQENIRVGARKGWSADVTAAKNLEDLTKLHVGVANAMAVSDPTGMAEYFEKNKGEIDGSLHDTMGKRAKEVSGNALGELTGAAIYEKFKPQNDGAPVELDKMLAAVREAFPKDSVAQKAAIAHVQQSAAAHNAAQAERLAGHTNTVYDAWAENKSLPAIERMPEWAALSGSQRNKLRKEFEGEIQKKADDALAAVERAERKADRLDNKAWQNEQRARQRREDAERAKIKANDDAYLRYSDPAALAGMTPAQIRALRGDLGTTHTAALLAKKESISKSAEALEEAKIDDDDFKTIARGAKLNPDAPPKDKDERERVGGLKAATERAVIAAQKEKKGPLTRTEKLEVMQRTVDDTVLINEWGRDPAKPVAALTKKEIESAYVVVDGAEVKLSSIPANDRAAISAGLRRIGEVPTEQAIAEVWMSKQRKKPYTPSGERK